MWNHWEHFHGDCCFLPPPEGKIPVGRKKKGVPLLMCLVSHSLFFYIYIYSQISLFLPQSCGVNVAGNTSRPRGAITLTLPFIFTYKLTPTLVCSGVEVYIWTCVQPVGCAGVDCAHYALISHEMVKLSCSLLLFFFLRAPCEY